MGGAVSVLVVEVVALVASLAGLRELGVSVARRRGGEEPRRRGGRARWSPGSCRRGPGRCLGALGAYVGMLLVLRPVPGPVCLRLLRGALGRAGPPATVGER